jgi:hypothetical protein
MSDASGTADTVSSQAFTREQFKGYVDGLNPTWRVVGWAQPLGRAEQDRLQVQLVENASVLDTTTADIFRGDLLDAQIGDGRFGFLLRIPQRLFDGQRHKFTIQVADLDGNNELGDLDVALPKRAPARDQGRSPKTGAGLLRTVLAHRHASAEYDALSEAGELTRVLERIAVAYDHATALGCLYIHVLRRRIDADGLQTRLTRLSQSPDELEAVVREVLASDEARTLYRRGSENPFPDIKALEIWTRLRRLS